MNRIISLILVISAYGLTGLAQPNLFLKQYTQSQQSGYNGAHHIITSDGGMCMTISQFDSLLNNVVSSVVKTDASGNIQWQKRLDTVNMMPGNIIQCTDGGFFLALAGNFLSSNFYIVLRLDAGGNTVFQKRLDLASGNENFDPPHSIERNNGHFFIACDNLNNTTQVGSWNVIELDENGNAIWYNSYNDDVNTTYLMEIDTCSNGDLLLAGTYNDTAQAIANAMISRISTSGSLLWTKRYSSGGFYDLFVEGMVPVAGGFILAVMPSNIWGGTHTQVVKIDENGTVLWCVEYRLSNSSLAARDVIVDTEQNILVVGNTYAFGYGSFYLNWIPQELRFVFAASLIG